MASIGHIAVGMAAARADAPAKRPGIAAFVFWSGLSLLPDLDVIGFGLGVRYGDEWGHRGATHSIATALLLGVAVATAARIVRRPALRTGILAALVLASHGLLDTLTDGGLGCALLWPFDLTRYFAPWRPIPVAPIGAAFFSAGGAVVAATELALFAPLFITAVWPRRRDVPRAAAISGLALWAVTVWLLVSTDPVREAAVGMVLREDTAYSSSYSEPGFRAVTRGDSPADVTRRIGLPFRQSWFYPPPGERAARAAELAASNAPAECMTAMFEEGALTAAIAAEPCTRRGVRRGMSPQDVEGLLGPPRESCWSYTWSPGDRWHRVRMVCFAGGRVDATFRYWN